jgi:NAD(P) transhydrogenase subunit alpha
MVQRRHDGDGESDGGLEQGDEGRDTQSAHNLPASVTKRRPVSRYRRPRGRRDEEPRPLFGWGAPSNAGLRGRGAMSHNTLLVFEVTILVLAIFLGFEVISKVPAMLHTPLMSGTNAIHGIVIVGAMLVAGLDHKDTLTTVVGLIAVVLASANVVGGFVVTDRMLEMFKKREPAQRKQPEDDA